jgi:hypothetical protein
MRESGWRRRGEFRGQLPKKAELFPSLLCIGFHPAARWRARPVRVVLGRGRDAAVIGLVRLGGGPFYPHRAAKWVQFSPEKGRVSAAQLRLAPPQGDRQTCLSCREAKFHNFFPLRQDQLGVASRVDPEAPRWRETAKWTSLGAA